MAEEWRTFYNWGDNASFLVQLFYWINSLAGRSAALDAAMRFFYVSAVPLLWTAFFAVLLLRPRRAPNAASDAVKDAEAASIRRVATFSVPVVLAGCAFTMWAVGGLTQHWLGLEILSPRPFVTHWVNLLVVEPNDNSFPCPETILAGGAATLLWAITAGGEWPRAGVWAWGAAGLLALARLFCGTNYLVDVIAGLGLGWAWAALPLALGRVSLWPSQRQASPRPGYTRPQVALPQVALSIAIMGAFALIAVWNSPRSQTTGGPARSSLSSAVAAASSQGATHRGPESTLHEGEGAPAGEATADAPRFAAHYGRQPAAEAHLRRAVAALKLPLPLSDLEVAQVRVGDADFRVAQARFEVPGRGAQERQRVTGVAAALVKTCFRHDASLQNVDVTAVVLRPLPPSPQNPGGADLKAVPVFTASVQRRNLVLTSGPKWANAPGTDPGLWLRARSQLYIDPKILPSTMRPKPAMPKPAPAKAPSQPAITPHKAIKNPPLPKPLKPAPMQPTPQQRAPVPPASQRPAAPQSGPVSIRRSLRKPLLRTSKFGRRRFQSPRRARRVRRWRH